MQTGSPQIPPAPHPARLRSSSISEPVPGWNRSAPRPRLAAFQEQALVEAAREGDESAFHRLVDALRGELYAHCHRMLASGHDAEDAMQEVMLRAWRALPTYEGRAPLRAWLYRIATNACLDAIEKRPKRVVPIDRAWSANRHLEAPIEPAAWHEGNGRAPGAHDGGLAVETDYERRETAMRALDVAIHYLPARQRAVLILREVLGFSARETASSLDTTISAVNSALQRARASLDHGLDLDGPQRSSRAPRDRRRQHAVEGFVNALRRGDIDALVAIAADTTLSNDRSWTVSPLPSY